MSGKIDMNNFGPDAWAGGGGASNMSIGPALPPAEGAIDCDRLRDALQQADRALGIARDKVAVALSICGMP